MIPLRVFATLHLQIVFLFVILHSQTKPDIAWHHDRVTSPGKAYGQTQWQVNIPKPTPNYLANHVTKTTDMVICTKPSQQNRSLCYHITDYLFGHKVNSLRIFLSLIRKKFPTHLPKPSRPLLFFLFLIIVQSNDIESNPGPSNDSTKYMCGTCDNTVTWEHRGIVCETCDQWFHIDCQNIHSNTYDQLSDSMVSWHCLICDNPNYSTCPYDLHSKHSIPPNPFESLLQQSDLDNENNLKSPTASFKPSHQSTPKQIHRPKHKNKTPLRILNINFQSIKRKQHLVNNIIESLKSDIVFGTETWLDPTIKNSEIFPDGFKIYRRDRTGQQGGGVLIAIKDHYISDEVEDLSPDDKCEMIWAKIEIVGCKTLYLSSFYNPKTSDEQSLNWFDTSVRRASQIKNSSILIGGDFNLPNWDWKNKILKPNSSYPKNHYLFDNTLDDLGLTQVVVQPTRKDNILDLIITNLPNQVPRIEIMPGIS